MKNLYRLNPKNLVYLIDGRVNLIVILFLFWASFWGLNGGDKFFNGEFVPNLDDWSTKGVLVGPDGNITHTLHKMETVGPFGVNRDDKMIAFFERIYLPKGVALGSLYGIAVLELLLGLTFLALFIWSLLPEDQQQKTELFANRTIHRLAFKGSIVVFVIFCTGDILFGERMELWEHGTFIVMTLVTYDMWYRTDRFFIEQRRERGAPSSQEMAYGSTQASSYQEELTRLPEEQGVE